MMDMGAMSVSVDDSSLGTDEEIPIMDEEASAQCTLYALVRVVRSTGCNIRYLVGYTPRGRERDSLANQTPIIDGYTSPRSLNST